jgi:phosphate transport system substrate-binding protein
MRGMALVAAAVLTVCLIAGCGGGGGDGEKAAPKPTKLTIKNCGSDTMVNLAQMWSERYQKVAPDVSVEVGGGGSGVGIRDLMENLVDIANASRKMKEAEREQAKKKFGKDPVEWIVGYDAMAIYAHKDNPVEELTVEQLAAIYGEGGSVDKWSQIGVTIKGSDEIVRVSRQNSSGTYFFFREHVLNKKDFKLGSRDMSGSKDVVELVGNTPGAIGYSGMGYKTDAVKFVKIAPKKGETAYMPSLKNVVDGKYSLARPLHMYTLGQPTGHVKKYIDWVLSPEGQKIVQEAGYVPVAAAEGP